MQNCIYNHMHIPQVKSGLKANRIVGTIESFVELRSLKCCKRINETEKISNIEWRALNQLIKIFTWALAFLHIQTNLNSNHSFSFLLLLTAARIHLATVQSTTISFVITTDNANLATVQSIYVSFVGRLIINRYILMYT